jgi:hypothetical protein
LQAKRSRKNKWISSVDFRRPMSWMATTP